MKRILIILLCVVLIGGIVFWIYAAICAQKFKNDALKSCTVYTGGGMRGGHSEVSLQQDAEGGAILRVSQKETYADREVTTIYRVSGDAFNRVREMAVKYDLYRASKRPYSKLLILDADTTSVSFSFQKDSFRVSGNQVLGIGMRKGFRAVIGYLDSLAVGDCVTTKEPQSAMLYLEGGHTLRFIVEDAFESKLDAILGEEREVSEFADSGIILAEDVAPDLTDASPADDTGAGNIVYDPQSRQIILLYADHAFTQPVYLLAKLDGDVASACPLIAEMKGVYDLYLNN